MFLFFFKVGSGFSKFSLSFVLKKKLLTRLHWIGHKHCISVIGWIELIHARGSLSACLLLLTNLRGKIGIQLVWLEELSLSPVLFFYICYPISWSFSYLPCAIIHTFFLSLISSSPFYSSRYLSENFLTTAAKLTQRGERFSISSALGALSFTIHPGILALHPMVNLISLLAFFHMYLFCPPPAYTQLKYKSLLMEG